MTKSDSWWDRALNNIAPIVQPRPGLPQKAAQWQQPQQPQQPQSRVQPGLPAFDPAPPIHDMSYQEAMAGAGGYVPKAGTVKSLEDNKVPSNCPECDSRNYFSRSTGAKVFSRNTNSYVTPAPHCNDCGYNGELVGYQEAGPAQQGVAVAATRQLAQQSHIDFSHPFAHVK